MPYVDSAIKLGSLRISSGFAGVLAEPACNLLFPMRSTGRMRLPLTLRDLHANDWSLRVWCLQCARGSVVEPPPWEDFQARGWPLDLGRAARRFRCRQCRSAGSVILLPASKPKPAPPEPEDDGWFAIPTNSQLVSQFFHLTRSLAKRARRKR
jgi:hypothetical protein